MMVHGTLKQFSFKELLEKKETLYHSIKSSFNSGEGVPANDGGVQTFSQIGYNRHRDRMSRLASLQHFRNLRALHTL